MLKSRSDSIVKLAKSLVACQPKVDNASKNATNPAFRSKYANLESVIDTFKEDAGSVGVIQLQSPGMEDGRATLTTMLIHESGEFMEFVHSIPLAKNDPQGYGSAITYLRRYATAAIWNLTQTDDDGHAASAPKPAVAPPPAAPAPPAVDEKKVLLGQVKQLVGELTQKRSFLKDILDIEAKAQIDAEIDTKFPDGKGTVDRLKKIVGYLKEQIAL